MGSPRTHNPGWQSEIWESSGAQGQILLEGAGPGQQLLLWLNFFSLLKHFKIAILSFSKAFQKTKW